MSPRSGTPVKLLGREDASVDWYNLEKSKRVKAFRCGEFDDCIKRAEASQGCLKRKRNMPVEKMQYFMLLNLRESVTSSEYPENGNGRHIGTKYHQVSTRSGVSLEDKSALNVSFAEIPKDRNQLSGDVDNSGVLPRMSVHAAPDGSNNTEGMVNVEKRSTLEKRKPSDDALSSEEFAQLLSLSRVSRFHLRKGAASGLNRLQRIAGLDGAASIELEPKYVGRSEALPEHGSMSSEEVDDFTLADGTSHPCHQESVSAGFGDDLATKSKVQKMAGYGSRAPEDAGREADEYFDPMNSYRHVGGRTMLAIIGHPIQVETLANGSTESFFGDIDNCPETLDNDTSLQPTWRTARRTANVRVPRPHVSSASDNPEGIKHVQGSDHHRNVRKATVGGCIQKASMTRKTTSRPSIERTFSKKPGKKLSRSGRALKPETLPTVVACIRQMQSPVSEQLEC
ncbi:hypothetical protein HAX54_023541 [Datura stramonium]|uniref:Uncharacterized protein n=1 Tax=Datura stramonium TaxID=4076 RepID=A0ABS8S5P8_DATST|nr:hypothetical protein [Datura stramonium]